VFARCGGGVGAAAGGSPPGPRPMPKADEWLLVLGGEEAIFVYAWADILNRIQAVAATGECGRPRGCRCSDLGLEGGGEIWAEDPSGAGVAVAGLVDERRGDAVHDY
jgi:hypothetical protein